MDRFLLAALVSLLAIPASGEEAKGRVVIAVGVCDQSVAELPVLWFRKVDKSADFSARGASFGQWDYTDATGKFDVRSSLLAAGEWEMYRFEFITRQAMGRTYRHYPRNEFSYRFTVAPGKIVDLGRYCAATQTIGEKYPDSDKVWNQVVRRAYIHVSPNREADVENARKADGGLLERVDARPDPPERAYPGMRSRFIEPRVTSRPALQQAPGGPPTTPVQ